MTAKEIRKKLMESKPYVIVGINNRGNIANIFLHLGRFKTEEEANKCLKIEKRDNKHHKVIRYDKEQWIVKQIIEWGHMPEEKF